VRWFILLRTYLSVNIRFRHRPQQFVAVTPVLSPFRDLSCLSRKCGNKAAFNIRYICNVGVLYLPTYLQIPRTQSMLLAFLELLSLPDPPEHFVCCPPNTSKNHQLQISYNSLYFREKKNVTQYFFFTTNFNLSYNISPKNLKCW
jgi:hypothetical protein